MIRELDCSHVIVGHSERRKYFGETNESVLEKTVAAIAAGLTPIVALESEKRRTREKAQPGIDGLLVGGASLDPVSFGEIVNLSICQASRTSSVSYAKSRVIESG